MRKRLLTRYGSVVLSVRELLPRRIYILQNSHTFRAGRKMRNGKKLSQDHTLPRGAVLLLHWEGFGTPSAKRLFYVYERGLFEALRAVLHAQLGYGAKDSPGEMQKLRKFVSDLEHCISQLLRYPELSPEKLREVQDNLAAIAVSLELARNEFKSEASTKLVAAATLETERKADGKRIRNPAATSARAVAAKNRLEKRAEEIQHIASYIASLERALALEIGRVLDFFERLSSNFSLELKRLRRRASYNKKECLVFYSKYNRTMDSLRMVDSHPFVNTAGLIRRDLGQAASLLRRNQQAAGRCMDRILRSLRFKRAQANFERLAVMPFALRLESGRLTDSFINSLITRVKKFRKRVAHNLDDGDFSSPHKQEVIEYLNLAVIYLERRELKKAKRSMKAASYRL